MAASGRWNLQALRVIRAFICRLTRKAATPIPAISWWSSRPFFLQETVKRRRRPRRRPGFADHRSQWIGRSDASAGEPPRISREEISCFLVKGQDLGRTGQVIGWYSALGGRPSGAAQPLRQLANV